MPTKIYDTEDLELIDGTIVEMSPLKIKYLRQFMDKFDEIKDSNTDEESIIVLVECARIAMKQFYPVLKTKEDIEDSIDLPGIYRIIDICAGVKMNKEQQQVKEQPKQNTEKKENSWQMLDLVKLESEVFVLGAWKNFDELESSISMPELMALLESIRELDYNEKKFLAAMQGVDLDESKSNSEPDPWEAMKARVAAQVSGIGNGDPNDILSYQGQKAAQNGFGIGMGLEYEVIGKD
jgi:hypothetical protein